MLASDVAEKELEVVIESDCGSLLVGIFNLHE